MINTKSKFSNIDEYISTFNNDTQEVLNIIRNTIKKAAPDAIEKISWSMPTFYQNGNLIHFAAHKNHIGIYPAPDAIEEFKDELSKYKMTKGSIHFPLNKNIPADLLEKIVRYRVAINTKKES